MKRVLMIAFHFPPWVGGSGVERALRFATNLPKYGWEPIVLTAHPRAYEQSMPDAVQEIPTGVFVVRAPAWDTKRHLAVWGRYPSVLARPDRWVWWWLGAIPFGLKAIKRYGPCVVWSTYPIATAHKIGATLARLTHLPWMADFRDPMAQDDYPTDLPTWRSFENIERHTVSNAECCTFTTPGAVRLYQQRYPIFGSRFKLLENGYDEESFLNSLPSNEALNPGRLTILHSGIVYPADRDPTQLFDALAQLRSSNPRIYESLRLRFRGPVHEVLLRDLACRYRVEAAIEILPAIEHTKAVNEMSRADGLLILQGESCNAQIPAKFYEYLRARRPILILADPDGDTVQAALDSGMSAITSLRDTAGIGALLERFVGAPEQGTMPSESAIADSSRYVRTGQLAKFLEQVTAR